MINILLSSRIARVLFTNRLPELTGFRSTFSLFAVILVGAASVLPTTMEAEEAVQELALQDAITRALANNYEVEIESINPQVMSERLMMAEAAFDTRFEASYSYQSIDRPQNAQQYTATGGGGLTLSEPNIFLERNHVAKVGLVKRFTSGTLVELATSQNILDNSLNRNRISSLFNPEYETFTGITVTQPLFQGFGFAANRAEIRIAKSNSRMADLEWQSRTAGLVGLVMKRYYDVMFAHENMMIQKDAIGLAEKLLEDNRKRSNEGLIPPNDVYLAEAAVFQRREEAIIAETSYMERQNALQLLFKTVAEANEVVSILPVGSLSSEFSIPDRTDLLAQAWNHRYDLQQAMEVVNQREHQTAYARNQVKPRLDLFVSAGIHGLDENTSASYREAFDSQGPEWSAGLTYSMPFSFGRQKASARMAKFEEEQSRIDVKRLKVQVSLEIDTVLSRLKADQQRVETARKSLEVARKTLDGETKRLQEGVTTSYQVLEYQKEFSQTRSREIAALADLNKGMVDLWLITSQLLERRSIVISGNGYMQ